MVKEGKICLPRPKITSDRSKSVARMSSVVAGSNCFVVAVARNSLFLVYDARSSLLGSYRLHNLQTQKNHQMS